MQRLFILPFIFLMVCLMLTIGWFLYRAGDDATEVLARNALTEVMGRVSQAITRQTMGARETLNVIAPPPVPPAEAGQAPAALPFPKSRKELEDRLWLANSLFDESGLVRQDAWPRLPGSFVGAGSTLSAAMAAMLANDLEVPLAASEAQEFTLAALANAQRIGMGKLLPDRYFWARESEDPADLDAPPSIN